MIDIWCEDISKARYDTGFEVFKARCCCCWPHIVSRGLARSMWSTMHSQVCGEAQRGTGTGFINKPNKGRCRQWPLRCGFGRGGKADVYPEETNKALSVSWEVSQPRIASLERSSALIMSLRGDDHHAAPHIQPRPPSRLTIQSVSANSSSAAHAASKIEKKQHLRCYSQLSWW